MPILDDKWPFLYNAIFKINETAVDCNKYSKCLARGLKRYVKLSWENHKSTYDISITVNKYGSSKDH